MGHRTTVAAVVTAVLAALASPLVLADETDIPAMKQQLQKLQRQIDDLEPTRARMPPRPRPAVPAAPRPPSTRVPSRSRSGGSSSSWGSAAAAMRLPTGRRTSTRRSRTPNSHNYDLSEFHLTERQSRISALAQGPSDASYATEAYVETDFGGSTTNGNNNQSASFAPRVRHFYADYQDLAHGWYLLFGQNWSFVTAGRPACSRGRKTSHSPSTASTYPASTGCGSPRYAW